MLSKGQVRHFDSNYFWPLKPIEFIHFKLRYMETQGRKKLLEFLAIIENRHVDSSLFESMLLNGIVGIQFESRYLIGNKFKQFGDISYQESGGDNLIFYVEEIGVIPYQAIYENMKNPILVSFKFLCAGCLAEDSNCNVCGGSGWGVI